MDNFFKKKEVFAVIMVLGFLSLSLSTAFYKSNSFISEIKYESASNSESESGFNFIEAELRENLIGRFIFTDIFGYVQKIMLKHETGNFEFIKSKDGTLYNGAFYIEDDDNLVLYAKNLRKLGATASTVGARTLFINYPEKNWTAENVTKGLPLRDYEFVEDQFLTMLMQNRVDNIDLRTYFRRIDVDKKMLYYKTDRSMNNYGSFLAFCSILQGLEDMYQLKLDPDNIYTDISNYNIEKYPNVFLGDMGRSYGKTFSGLDDIEIYRTKYPQEYIWEYQQNGLNYMKRGNEDIFFNLNYLNEENPYSRKSMDVFLEGLNDVDKITNLKNNTAPKILFIRDDNFSPIAAFMAPLCSELHLINPMGGTDIDSYISTHQFDYVIMCVSSGRINNHYFDFYKN